MLGVVGIKRLKDFFNKVLVEAVVPSNVKTKNSNT